MDKSCCVCGRNMVRSLSKHRYFVGASCKKIAPTLHSLPFPKKCVSGTLYPARSLTTQTYTDDELNKFSKLSKRWWDRDGDMKALHSMNSMRIPFIRDNLLLQGYGDVNSGKPLRDVSILDIGCGAGILSESLSRLGGSVLGIDPATEVIDAAKLHRDKDADLKELQYLDSPLEDIVAVGTLKFDCVVASEVIEHTINPVEFIKMCAAVLKPHGSLFISTINRTAMSKLLAVCVAENLLGVLPRGTHDWDKFITTDEMVQMLSQHGFYLRKILGMDYNPFLDKWSWSNHHYINYIIHAMREEDPQSLKDKTS